MCNFALVISAICETSVSRFSVAPRRHNNCKTRCAYSELSNDSFVATSTEQFADL
jgi:hypothetical protein